MTPETIKTARLALGVSTGDFARLMRVDKRTVERWEAGDRDIPGPATIMVEVLIQSPQARLLCGLSGHLRREVDFG